MAAKQRLIVLAIGLLLFLWVSPFSQAGLTAEPAKPAEQAGATGYLQYQDPAKPGTTAWGTAAYIITLLFMFIGIIVFAYLTSRFIATRASRLGQTGGSRIHLTLPLAPNRNLHLVEMAGRFFVIGVTEQSVQLLFMIDDPDSLKEYIASKPAEANHFEDVFARQLNAMKDLRSSFPHVFQTNEKKDDRSEKEKR